MLKKWGHTGKSLFYKSVLVLWAALEPIGYRIIFQKIQYSTRSTVYPIGWFRLNLEKWKMDESSPWPKLGEYQN